MGRSHWYSPSIIAPPPSRQHPVPTLTFQDPYTPCRPPPRAAPPTAPQALAHPLPAQPPCAPVGAPTGVSSTPETHSPQERVPDTHQKNDFDLVLEGIEIVDPTGYCSSPVQEAEQMGRLSDSSNMMEPMSRDQRPATEDSSSLDAVLATSKELPLLDGPCDALNEPTCAGSSQDRPIIVESCEGTLPVDTTGECDRSPSRGTYTHPKERAEDHGTPATPHGTVDISRGETPCERQALSTPGAEIAVPQHQCSLNTPGCPTGIRTEGTTIHSESHSGDDSGVIYQGNACPAAEIPDSQGSPQPGNVMGHARNKRQRRESVGHAGVSEEPSPAGPPLSKRHKRSSQLSASCPTETSSIADSGDMGDQGVSDGGNNPDDDNQQENNADTPHLGPRRSKRLKRSIQPASSCSSAADFDVAGVYMGELETGDGSDPDDGQATDADGCYPARSPPRRKRAAASAGRSSKATPSQADRGRHCSRGDDDLAIPIRGLLTFHACPSRPFYTVSFACDDATSPQPDTENTVASAAHFSQKQPPTSPQPPRYPRVEVVIPTSRRARDPPGYEERMSDQRATRSRWPGADDKLLLSMRRQNKPWEVIQQRFPNRTLASLRQRCSILNNRSTPRRPSSHGRKRIRRSG